MNLDDFEENITQYCRREEGEQVDDLQCAGLRILQKKGTFRYGTDAVLLANYAAGAIKSSVRLLKRLRSPGKTESTGAVRVVDVGTGTGIIPVLMYGKLNAEEGIDPEGANYTAVEIQAEACELLNQSVRLNDLAGNLTVLNADLKNLRGSLPFGAFDLVACNPPYKLSGTGVPNPGDKKLLARHETACTLDDICAAAAGLLQFGGRFCICQRPERLPDVMESMRRSDIEPKTLRLVQQRRDKAPKLFLLEGRKGGKRGYMETLPTLFIEDETGDFSEEMREIYGNYKSDHEETI